MTSPTDAKAFLLKLDEDEVKFVDLRFTDPMGQWHHMTYDISILDEETLTEGVMFDGSSIAGWKAINESDMRLQPDLETAAPDPFCAQNTLILVCDVLEPDTGQPYQRDPRSTARKAEAALRQSGIADQVFIGPEAEFFVFDDVRFLTDPHQTGFALDSTEASFNTNTEYEVGNMGHRPKPNGGYFPVPPVDSAQDLRSEMLSNMTEMGIEVEKHHHEVGAAQHELGIKFAPLTRMGDMMQIYRYVVRNVAHSFGKTATFMPKPVFGENGSGMHVHQSLWKNGKPLFAGNQYAGLSEECLYYIGGVLKHAKALAAFTNPTTNSYKRLVPGFEAPVMLAYSARNRSAACRIPYVGSAKARRIEIRFPDPSANPYLAFAAMLMAGMDGIENRIHPGEPMEKDLYDLPPTEQKNIPTIATSLAEACDSLHNDRAFLTRDGVFTDDQIDAFLEQKHAEIARVNQMPHPVEFSMYYSV